MYDFAAKNIKLARDLNFVTIEVTSKFRLPYTLKINK